MALCVGCGKEIAEYHRLCPNCLELEKEQFGEFPNVLIKGKAE